MRNLNKNEYVAAAAGGAVVGAGGSVAFLMERKKRTRLLEALENGLEDRCLVRDGESTKFVKMGFLRKKETEVPLTITNDDRLVLEIQHKINDIKMSRKEKARWLNVLGALAEKQFDAQFSAPKKKEETTEKETEKAK